MLNSNNIKSYENKTISNIENTTITSTLPVCLSTLFTFAMKSNDQALSMWLCNGIDKEFVSLETSLNSAETLASCASIVMFDHQKIMNDNVVDELELDVARSFLQCLSKVYIYI